jgi:serine/threonine-protein kinase
MGEVYRATDTSLGRQVAIKIVPDAFADDPERLARFEREAKTLASLNHPNIAHIYGLEKTDGIRALIMELVEGPTVAERIAQGPIPLDDALPIARQIAEALEAAHEQGIVHRDLKPANIKLRPDGVVKVLDFGLAKQLAPMSGGGDATASPTIMSPTVITGVAVLLGTAAYMSPEQAKGKAADKRSDIWAFGCVLFEMLAGRRAFPGEDIGDTFAAVLRADPDWSALPNETPVPIRRLLRRCLQKDRRKRLADVADTRMEIEDAASAGPAGVRDPEGLPADASSAPTGRPYQWMAGMAALVVALIATLIAWSPWQTVTAPAPWRLMAELGANVELVNSGSAIVLSPDGALLAFVAPNTTGGVFQLYVRRLDQLQATALPGTEDARNPFFSPDGQWIGFFADDKLKKVSVTGGPAVTLCDAPNARGGAWAEDGSIFFQAPAQDMPLFRVSSAGGKPLAATTLRNGEITQRWPQALPGSTAVLYTSHSAGGDFDAANIVVQPLPAGERKVVVTGGYFGRYVQTGHLLYVRDGTLFAAPFNLDRLDVIGESVPVLEDIASAPTGTGANGAAQFAVSNTGTLVYLPSGSLVGRSIEWMDRSGRMETLRKSPATWANPRFAPDGQRLAMDIDDGAHSDVWVYEWARDTLTRLTVDPGEAERPIWTTDGSHIAYTSRRGERLRANLYWRPSDGTSDEQRLTESANNQFGGSWHPIEKLLAFTEITTKTRGDLMLLRLEGDDRSDWKEEKPTVFLATPAFEQDPIFSPDGGWVAYSSDESGRNEVYVRPFPGPGGKWQVSSAGGEFPIWSRAKNELLYRGLDQRIMVLPYAIKGDAFVAEKPRPWSEQPIFAAPSPGRSSDLMDLHPDGERVAFAAATQSASARQVVFVFNFFQELKRLVPVN